MSNDRIRVSFTEDYPDVNRNCSRIPHFRVGSSCPMPGFTVEIIALITNYLNLTVDVAKVRSVDRNDTYDEVYNNETDVYAFLYAQTTPAHAIKHDFTKEIYPMYIKIAIRRRDHSLMSIFDFFAVYRLDAWIGMIVVFVLFTAFGLLVRYVECQLVLRGRCNFAEVLWKMARFQLVQPERIDYNLIAGESSLLVFSLFQVCVILGLFQGFILTSIVKKVDSAPFNSNDFPQLVKDKKLAIVKPTGTRWIFQEIETSYESPFYELREALKSNPYKLVETKEDALRTVDEGNGAVTLVAHDWYIAWPPESHCNLVHVDSLIRPRSQRFMFRKGSRFVPMFNRAIDANVYLIERIIQKYAKHKPPSKCTTQSTDPRPLSMAPYYGLLIPFLVGMSSACFVFSGELLKWTMSRKQIVSSDWFTFGISNSGALMSGGGVATEGNSAVTAIDPPMSSEQDMLPAAGSGGNSLTLTALSAEIVAAAGLPPGTKLYALIPQNKQPQKSRVN